MEYGMLGKMFWGKNGQLLNALNIIIYLYGNNITIGVIVGNTLS